MSIHGSTTTSSTSTTPTTSTNKFNVFRTMSRIGNILPRASRVIPGKDPSSIINYDRVGAQKEPRSVAAWAHHSKNRSSRLVLTLDLSSEATGIRNKLKSKHLHPWGTFPDTRVDLIDPLPERNFYMKMYKDAINDFCLEAPSSFPMRPSTNYFVAEDRRESGLVEEEYGNRDYMERKPKPPTTQHALIMMSLPKASVAHKLREYFLKVFGKFPNEEVRTIMKRLEKERYKAQIPLGFCREMGSRHAEESKNDLARDFGSTSGIDLGHAVSLSLWRRNYQVNMARKWGKPELVDIECLYSRAFKGTEEQPSFVSIAPEEQSVEEALDEVATRTES
ncbi:61396fb8-4e48-4423-8841-4e778581d897-CDS [Sclerotinia trifoliorum]|uniref:61396fb8-4e48-4423-8841-4e778581d897-CDS n=1 Tax=Sclerotinia trifoliorum TaxID=28548 RepID=A0A8H2VMK9_9HELO|nr:61396fb8-4e48-4423-8841-4e778581d897-CDS [Sclerotinia trifoliorum]